MNRIPKAVYTKECREEAVKLAMTVLSRCWEVDQVLGRLERRVESLHTLVAKPDICGYRSANVSKATASDEYQALLKQHHVVCSMSRKGNRWDTQSKIASERRTDLTRVGIGRAALALTCRSGSGVPRALPGSPSVT
jgi:hypothetical protein